MRPFQPLSLIHIPSVQPWKLFRFQSIIWLAFILATSAIAQPDSNTVACNLVYARAFESKLIERPIGDVIAIVGKEFLGKPYEANTLDRSDTERVVVNLQTFDCVTFVENVLALSRTIKNNTLNFDAYTRELESIRYRGGIANGYASRLHYFSDWIYENQKKGLVKDVTRGAGGKAYKKRINFMSTHRSSYKQLASDSLFAVIRQGESMLSTRKLLSAPKEKLRNWQSKIQNGDIIAITTNIDGLDVSHTGIAIRMEDGLLHYMHAPDVGDSVRVSNEPLWQYLQKNSTQTGIMVVRATEVP